MRVGVFTSPAEREDKRLLISGVFGRPALASDVEQLTGRTNTPHMLGHRKYRVRCTAPSFLPHGSDSSTPNQMPSLNNVFPKNRTNPHFFNLMSHKNDKK